MDLENEKKANGCKPFFIGCGVIVAVVVFALIAFFIWATSGPEGGVLFNNEMEEYAIKYIEEHKILNDGEEIIAYYDYTISLDGTEAAILTNERILYHKNESTKGFNLIDIIDVKHRYDKTTGDIIELTNKDGKFMKIEIAPLNDGESFYNALMGILKAKGVEVE